MAPKNASGTQSMNDLYIYLDLNLDPEPDSNTNTNRNTIANIDIFYLNTTKLSRTCSFKLIYFNTFFGHMIFSPEIKFQSIL